MKFIISIYLIISLLILDHQYYISATKVVFSKKNNSFECTARIFSDDLESLFKEEYKDFYTKESDEIKFDSLIKIHIFRNFNVFLNEVRLKQFFIGSEIIDDLVITYFEFPANDSLVNIKIENTVLMDHISEQKNIIHLEIEDFKKSYLLSRQKPILTYN